MEHRRHSREQQERKLGDNNRMQNLGEKITENRVNSCKCVEQKVLCLYRV